MVEVYNSNKIMITPLKLFSLRYTLSMKAICIDGFII